jgi:copper chaperone CopZ
MKVKTVAILSAVLGSICCVGPLVLIALGVGAGAVFIGRYHWFFVAAAIAVLGWAWLKHFREKVPCACEHRGPGSNGISLPTLLITSAVVVGFTALNFSSYIFAGPPPLAAIPTANLRRVIIPVAGLTCVTCEIPVRGALKRIDGVRFAYVSAATQNATVDYDPAKTNPEKLVAAINSTGYRAAPPNK